MRFNNKTVFSLLALFFFFIAFRLLLLSTSSHVSQEDEEWEEPKRRRFRLDTPGCRILAELPLLENTRPLFANYVNPCHVSKHAMIQFERVSGEWVRIRGRNGSHCLYSEVKEGKDEKHFLFSRPRALHKSRIRFKNKRLVRIQCFDKSEELVGESIIPLIPRIPRILTANKVSFPVYSSPSVLLIRIQSPLLSHVTLFKKYLPKSARFLHYNGFQELHGFTRIEENTWSNIIPLLTGHSPQKQNKQNISRNNNHFHSFPPIWQKFEKQNFRSLVVEEEQKEGLFHNLLRPAHFHLHQFERVIQSKKYKDFCYAGKLITQHFFDFYADFSRAMRKRGEKHFAYLSVSELTRDLNTSGHLDRPLLRLLTRLKESESFKDTFILLISENSGNNGAISGQPLMFVRLPDSGVGLRDRTEAEVKESLAINTNRLTTPLDIYVTLRHLIDGKSMNNNNESVGQSLFTDISAQRECADAGIADNSCECLESETTNGPEVRLMAEEVVKRVNQWTERERKRCHVFSIESVLLAYKKARANDGRDNHVIRVKVSPGDAVFEASVRLVGGEAAVIGSVERVSKNTRELKCVQNAFLEKYCFCSENRI